MNAAYKTYKDRGGGPSSPLHGAKTFLSDSSSNGNAIISSARDDGN